MPQKSKKARYYYPGSFENTGHFKLANGCYFVKVKGSDCNGLVKYIDVDIGVPESVLITAREKRLEYAISNGFEVKHLTD